MKESFLGSIMNISRCCNSYRRVKTHNLDINPAMHLYISAACNHPGCTPDDLAVHFCLDRTTVTHQLDKLEELGYIERRISSDDGRKKCIYPTEKAIETYPKIHELFNDFKVKLLKGLSEEDIMKIQEYIDIMRKNAAEITDESLRGM